MHETDDTETEFLSLPPPPPMTAEQCARAEASIQAALAREAERKARLMCLEADFDEELCEKVCMSAAMPEVCGGATPREIRKSHLFGRFV